MAKTIDEIIQELRNVGDKLDGIIVQLRLFQESKLEKTCDDNDLKEVRTIKEIIQQLESVA